MEKLNFSLIVITLNEESSIERCIKSVPFAGEVVVVDSGSQDRTLEIARGLGAVTHTEEWQGYSKQKTKAAEIASHKWILSLDADEALSEKAQGELFQLVQELTSGGESYDGYAFPRLTEVAGKWIYHGGLYPDYQTRFYNRDRARWADKAVHEHIEADKVKKLKHPIYHWSFKNIRNQIETINKYSSLRAKEMHRKNKKFSVLTLLTKPVYKFFEVYILKRAFLDGRAGIIVAYVASYATFLRWAKLYEIQVLGRDEV